MNRIFRFILLFLFFAAMALAQAPGPDDKRCKDSTILSRMPDCRIARCRAAQYEMFEMPVSKLAAKGIEKSRLVPAGFGSKRPVADNSTEDGKAKNRRVDLVKLY